VANSRARSGGRNYCGYRNKRKKGNAGVPEQEADPGVTEEKNQEKETQ
jgi:hypothetical protein